MATLVAVATISATVHMPPESVGIGQRGNFFVRGGGAPAVFVVLLQKFHKFRKKKLWGTPEAVRYDPIRPLPFELDRNESRAFRRAGSFAMRHFDSAFAIYGVLALCLIAGGNAPLASRIVPG